LHKTALTSAVIKYPQTETCYDLIDFTDKTTGYRELLSYSGVGDESDAGLYTCSSGEGAIKTTHLGDVELTIAPALETTSNTFNFKSGSDQASKTITSIQTLRIPAADFSMDPTGKYAISFDMTNIILLKAKLVNVREILEYPPPPAASRVVDFSQKVDGKPKYDANEVVFGTNIDGSMSNTGQEYDGNLKYWVTKTSPGNADGSGYNGFYNKNIVGDFFCLMEDIGSAPPVTFLFDNDNFGSTTSAANSRYLPGLLRVSMPYGVYNSNDRAHFDLWNSNTAKYKMIYGGFTWPLNAVLYHGAEGSTLKKYSWQVIASGSVTDPNVACAAVTRDACEKLKKDWNGADESKDDLRIYVVKYRAQEKYKSKISGENVPHDYSAVDGCATGAGVPYLQNVGDEDGLKSALKKIADDIKSFGGYKPAKNVFI
jgi:hypothetical protein